jgi:hypothetical protein
MRRMREENIDDDDESRENVGKAPSNFHFPDNSSKSKS